MVKARGPGPRDGKSVRAKPDVERLSEAFHKKLCVTEHEAGTEGFPCGDALEVVRKRWGSNGINWERRKRGMI